MHGRKAERALHEQYNAALANEQVTIGGGMVPMHAEKTKGGFP